MGGWHWERMKGREFERIILRVFIICIPRSRLQPTCVALMVFRALIISEESQLGEMKWCPERGIKNGKAADRDEINGEMIEGWVTWRLCNMSFESGVVHEGSRSGVIVPLYMDKREMTECMNYRGIRLLNVVGKVYAVIFVERVHKLTAGLIYDEQGGFRLGH